MHIVCSILHWDFMGLQKVAVSVWVALLEPSLALEEQQTLVFLVVSPTLMAESPLQPSSKLFQLLGHCPAPLDTLRTPCSH